MKKRILVLLSLSLLLTVMVADVPRTSVKAMIDFPFAVGDKLLPVGEYEFLRIEDGAAFRVKGGDSEGVLTMVVTRLSGEKHESKSEAYLVFDKVMDHYHLAEIWFPGEDGYLIATTKGEHTHKTVGMK